MIVPNELHPRIGELEDEGFLIDECITVCSECVLPTDRSGSLMDEPPLPLTGETDAPNTCDRCGATILTSLTTDGEEYVLAQVGNDQDHPWREGFSYLFAG